MLSKKSLIVAGISASLIVGFGATLAYVFASQLSRDQKLRLATRWLDGGRWDVASGLVEELQDRKDLESNSLWYYVRGVSRLMKISGDLDSCENRLILRDVVEDLQKSREIGFPLGYRGKGNFYLGLSLFEQYQWDEAIDALTQSLQDHPAARSDSLRMICLAHLRGPITNVPAARSTLERWQRMPGLSKRELAQIRLTQAQLASYQDAHEETRRLLADIPKGTPEYFEGQRWDAYSLIRQAALHPENTEARRRLLDQAQGVLRRLTNDANTPDLTRRQAYFLTGRCLREQGELQKAISVFSIVRQQSPFSAEAIAGGLEEAEMLLKLGQYPEVVNTTRHLLNGISDIRLFNEFWLSEEELRRRLIEIGNRLQAAGQYELALNMAEQLKLAFPLNHSLRLQGQVLSAWAAALESEVEKGSVDARQKMLEIYGMAGEKYEQLAALEMRSRDYLNIMWGAAENYQKASRLKDSGRLLELYLQYESKTKRPRGLLALGRNYMTQGLWRESLAPLQICLEEYPVSPSSYEARFMAARVLNELNEPDQAIDQLSANLWDYELNPESPVWKDSFIELGRLLFKRADRLLHAAQKNRAADPGQFESRLQDSHNAFLLAIDQLNETVKRYPQDPELPHTQYLLARSYQMASLLPEHSSASNSVLSEHARRSLRQQREQLLEQAADQYRRLNRSLATQKNLRNESIEPSLLRNAFFGEADILSDLKRFDEAIEAYRNTAAHYSNQPEALEALVRIVECYRNSGREAEAQKTVRQAELLLERIPDEQDTALVSLTRGDRQHWQKLLGLLKQWD